MNPLSQQMQAQGRGNDSVLVHMTPREVGGLQALAQSYGGTLTRNPTTGLPEAGFLDSILPMLAGAAGGAMGIDPWMAAAGAGLAQGAITGNLEKGLTAGLSAYGGASLGRTLNPEGTIGGFGFNTPAAPPTPSLTTINTAPAAPVPSDVAGIENMYSPEGLQNLYPTPSVAPTVKLEEPGFFDRFSANAARGLKDTGLEKFAPYAAGLGLAMPFLAGSNQTYKAPEPEKVNYAGPYQPMPRRVVYPTNRGPKNPRDSSEHMFFPDSNPYPGFLPADAFVAPTIRMAEGGLLPRAAPRTGLTAPEAPRYSGERTFNFPKSNYVPPAAAPPSAGLQALTQQYPTATKAQLSEYERAIEGGGDPSATRSLMQAYSPASNYTSLQPWSPDFKGFDYSRDHPVDAFGNPVGWTPTAEDEASRQKSLAVSGGMAGYAPLDFPDQYRPDDEYILNNPWTDGKIGGGAFVGELNLDPGTQWTKNSGGNDSPRIQNAYQLGVLNAANDTARANGAANNQTAINYMLYGGPDAPADASTPTPTASSGAQGVFNRALEATRAAPGAATPNAAGERTSLSGGNIVNILQNLLGFTGVGLPVSAGIAAARFGLDKYMGTNPADLAPRSGASWLERQATGPSMLTDVLNYGYNKATGRAAPKGQAAGGVNLEDGSFVVDARTVAELGNGSSGAGQEVLARLGGRPIHGPGDGVSDSIRANIGGTQEARVARDEVKFSPEAVKRLGRGNPKKGADRLYDMMKKAEKARKSASRGKDTGLRALAGAK
jgi:hypothetical protein